MRTIISGGRIPARDNLYCGRVSAGELSPNVARL